MRSLLVLLAALLLAVGAIVAVQSLGSNPVPDDADSQEPLGAQGDASRDVSPGGSGGPTAAVSDAAREAATIVPTVAAAPGRCVVVGRLLDDAGAPVANGLVQLFAKRRWARGSSAAPLADLDASGKLVGFEASTGEDGRFRIDAEPPTAKLVELLASRSPLAETVSRRFGRRGEEALTEGVRDLGDLTLRTAGAIRGVVVDEHDVGIAGAKVELKRPRTQQEASTAPPTVSVLSDASGRFEFAHLASGPCTLRASLDGRVTSFLPGVTVATERWVGPLTLHLVPGPEVTGQVVDDRGTPIAGAKVQARSEGGGLGVTVRTDDAGVFRAVLATTDDVQIRAAMEGYVAAEIGPVTTPALDLLVALKRESRSRVLVIDRATGQPVERFGLAVVVDGGSRSRIPLYIRRKAGKAADHEGGAVDISGRIGLDLIYVQAEGYIPAAADFGGAQWPQENALPEEGNWRVFAPDDGPFEQTVALDRGATLRGEFAEGAWESAKVGISEVDQRQIRFSFLNSNVQEVAATVAEPRFEFAGLAPGRWQLSAGTDGGMSTVVTDIELVAGETRDLGVLEVVPTGTVTGTVKLPPGTDVPEVSVVIADVPGAPKGVTDADGHFRIEGVPAGDRTIRNSTLHHELMWGGEVQVRVPAGGEVDVFLDLSQRGLVPIEITVEQDGATLEDVEVRLVRVDVWPLRSNFDIYEDHEIYLGQTHADGVARGRGRALGTTRPVIAVDRWKIFAPSDSEIELVGTETVEARVSIVSGDALLALPSGMALPTQGSARFSFQSVKDPRVRSWTTVQFEDGVPIRFDGLIPDATLRSWRVPTLPLGGWTFRVDLFEGGVAELRIGDTEAAAQANATRSETFVGGGTVEAGSLAQIELVRSE